MAKCGDERAKDSDADVVCWMVAGVGVGAVACHAKAAGVSPFSPGGVRRQLYTHPGLGNGDFSYAACVTVSSAKSLPTYTEN